MDGYPDPRVEAIGTLNIEAFESALPGMSSVVDQLRQAATALEASGGDGLVGPVASGYRDSVDGMSRRADLAARFRDSMQLATTMFGGQRRYLLSVPALGVPRPGGGIPAAVGLLVADNGSLELEPMTTAPKAISDIDVSLDWPKTARMLMKTVAGSEIGAVDGVISIDAVALQDLVWMIGDVDADGMAFSDETTTTGVEIDPFLGNNPPKTARVHAVRVFQILDALLDRRPGVESFALAGAADARGRHLSIYLPGAEERRLLRSLGLDGGAKLRGEGTLPVVATWSSLGNAHVGALGENDHPADGHDPTERVSIGRGGGAVRQRRGDGTTVGPARKAGRRPARGDVRVGRDALRAQDRETYRGRD